MIDQKAFANAAGLTAVILYVVCLVIALISPDLLFNIAQLTAHGVNLEPIRPVAGSINLVSALVGLVVWSALVWVTFYVGGYFYNKFRK